MDTLLFHKINGLAHFSSFLDSVGIFLATYFEYFLVVFLLIFLFWPKTKIVKNRLMVISSLVSAAISRFFIIEIIRFFYHRPRPYVALEAAEKIIAESKDFTSFPSGHAAFFFALATGIYFYNKKLGIFFFISAIAMGIARVFTGVHWPTDILAGAIVGVVVAWIVNKLMSKFVKHESKNQR
jgi:undecaprenyl-diphosphatase